MPLIVQIMQTMQSAAFLPDANPMGSRRTARSRLTVSWQGS